MVEKTKGFLETEDVIFLTGYKRPNAQCQWLAENGINYYVSKNGSNKIKVVVTWEALKGAN